MALKTYHGYICNDGVQFQMEIRKISRRRPRFVDTAKLGHFTLLFCRGLQRNVPLNNYNARAQLLFCSLSLLFGDVLLAVVVVVCLSSLMPLCKSFPLGNSRHILVVNLVASRVSHLTQPVSHLAELNFF